MIRVVHPGSGSWLFTHPGSRGQKGTRIRIHYNAGILPGTIIFKFIGRNKNSVPGFKTGECCERHASDWSISLLNNFCGNERFEFTRAVPSLNIHLDYVRRRKNFIGPWPTRRKVTWDTNKKTWTKKVREVGIGSATWGLVKEVFCCRIFFSSFFLRFC